MAQAGREPRGVYCLARLRFGGTRGRREVRWQQPAACHAELVAPVVEQAQVQPKFVLVRAERLHYRRSSEFREPGARGPRQLRDLRARRRRKCASEPRFGERECHCLETAHSRRVQCRPCRPEFFIGGMAVEEACQFVDVKNFGIALEHVLEEMERRVCHSVLRAEHVHFGTADGTAHSAGPELVDTGCVEPFEPRVPELKVQLDGEGHFGIEIIAAPTPFGAWKQSGQMVSGKLLHAGDTLVILREQRVAGAFHGVARKVEIDVVLRAIFRPDAEELAMRDAFESDEFAGQTGEAAIGFFGHLQAQAVLVCGSGRRFRQNLAEQEREALAIAPGERFTKAVAIKTGEVGCRGFTKVKRSQHRRDMGWEARAMRPEVRQFKIVPPFSC